MSRKPDATDTPAPEGQPMCFVIGPIGEAGSAINKAANWLLRGVIKPVLESDEFGYRVKRADEDASPGSIAHAVIRDVIQAELVIADLTGFNPNAFYELGLRHMVERPVIHVIGEMVRLPFDNQDQRTIFIDFSDVDEVEKSKNRLADMVRAIKADGYLETNPVIQAKATLALVQSGDPRDREMLDMRERLDRLESDTRWIPSPSIPWVSSVPAQPITWPNKYAVPKLSEPFAAKLAYLASLGEKGAEVRALVFGRPSSTTGEIVQVAGPFVYEGQQPTHVMGESGAWESIEPHLAALK